MIKKNELCGKTFLVFTVALLAGCAGTGGYQNSNLAGQSIQGTVLGSAILNSVTQNMANSVVNGQIGSQIAPLDQTFRLQQLSGLLQSGVVNQTQQWFNPQTGSTVSVNPTGQSTVHPQTQQQCQSLQETVTMPNGQTLTENRLACLNPQSGQWYLVK